MFAPGRNTRGREGDTAEDCGRKDGHTVRRSLVSVVLSFFLNDKTQILCTLLTTPCTLLNICSGGFSKPSFKDILWIQMFLWPWYLLQYIAFQVRWFYKFTLMVSDCFVAFCFVLALARVYIVVSLLFPRPLTLYSYPYFVLVPLLFVCSELRQW